MTTHVTDAMLNGWRWERNVLHAPNGRLHVACKHRTSSAGWNAEVVACSSADLPSCVGMNGRHLRALVHGMPTRRDAAVEALDMMCRGRGAWPPADDELVGLHPAFAERARQIRAQRELDRATSDLSRLTMGIDHARKTLANLPSRIAKMESGIPALERKVAEATAARKAAYDGRRPEEGAAR